MSLLQQTFISRSQLRSCYTRLFQSSPRHPELLLEMMGGEQNVRVMDNMCAAICRMVWTNSANLPLEYVRLHSSFPCLFACRLHPLPPPLHPPLEYVRLHSSLSFCLLSASPHPPPPPLKNTTTSSVHRTYNIFNISSCGPLKQKQKTASSVHRTYNVFNISCCGRLAQYSHSSVSADIQCTFSVWFASVDTDIQCTLSVWLSVLGVFLFCFQQHLFEMMTSF